MICYIPGCICCGSENFGLGSLHDDSVGLAGATPQFCFVAPYRFDHRFVASNPSGRTVYGVGLRPLPCWDCGFESRLGHGCLSLVSVVCCQVEVSTMG